MQIIKSKNINGSRKPEPESFNLTYIRGFSLIELIIVVAIMMVITSAVLFRQSKFSSDILITNMAYEVALSIREAAVFGLSSKYTDSDYRVGYGIHFGPDGASSPSEGFVTFIDKSLNPITDISPGDDAEFNYAFDHDFDDVLSTVQMTQGQTIYDFCASDGVDSWDCSGDYSYLDIVFVKPNPEAHITMGESGDPNGKTYSQAKITVVSSLGDKCRTVTVSASGQIAVDPVNTESLSGGCDIFE